LATAFDKQSYQLTAGGAMIPQGYPLYATVSGAGNVVYAVVGWDVDKTKMWPLMVLLGYTTEDQETIHGADLVGDFTYFTDLAPAKDHAQSRSEPPPQPLTFPSTGSEPTSAVRPTPSLGNRPASPPGLHTSVEIPEDEPADEPLGPRQSQRLAMNDLTRANPDDKQEQGR
jgi:hypothetical protein